MYRGRKKNRRMSIWLRREKQRQREEERTERNRVRAET